MKIAIATYDMLPEKAHLMPWRTLCEVVSHANSFNTAALLINLVDTNSWSYQDDDYDIDLAFANKSKSQLLDSVNRQIKQHGIDVIYWPISWREPGWRINLLAHLDAEVVVYFPGGVYGLASSLYAMHKLGFKTALPYLRDSLVNKQKFLARLKRSGIKKIIGLTALTTNTVISSGWGSQQAHFISLAKDQSSVSDELSELPSAFSSWLKNSPYYLFMGPPSGIRGIYELLKAFEKAASTNQDIKLVCLFRSDGELDKKNIKKIIDGSEFKHRIYSVWDSVTRPELNAYMSAAHAITMPFVLVPSEVPLAIIEAMRFHKPIIATSPGGTGHFVEQFGIAPKVGDINGLSDALLKLAEDKDYYQRTSEAVKTNYASLPSWQSMSEGWIKVGNELVRGRV